MISFSIPRITADRLARLGLACADDNTDIAQKITGAKTAVLFSSPIDPGVRLERLWAVPGAQPDENISVSALRAVVAAPAYWCDHELALLLMPITRGDSERQLNLDAHAMSMQSAALAA